MTDSIVTAGRWFHDRDLPELGAALVSLYVGISVVLFPAGAWATHSLTLLMWRFAPWQVSLGFLLAGGLTLAGIGLFAWCGRCVLARWVRLAGQVLGVLVWSVLLLNTLEEFGLEFTMLGAYAWFAFAFAHAIPRGFRRN